MLHDPVCGKRIKRNRAYVAIDFQGVTYYLCCPRCQANFELEPQKFARSEFGEKAKPSLAREKKDHRNNQPMRSGNIVRGMH